jgi:NADPH2:quinone reductase
MIVLRMHGRPLSKAKETSMAATACSAVEAAGVVEAYPGGEFAPGQQVATLAGGMGRVFDGGYAEHTRVPVGQVVPFTSSLEWPILGALPVMLETANGSLRVGINAKPDQALLVRSGTSSVGMATAVLAKQLRMTVFSTTRNPAKAKDLDEIGVDVHKVVWRSETADARLVVADVVQASLGRRGGAQTGLLSFWGPQSGHTSSVA